MVSDYPRDDREPPRPTYRLIRQQCQPTEWLGWHLDVPEGVPAAHTAGLPHLVWRERRMMWPR